jgi:hypothetical protein
MARRRRKENARIKRTRSWFEDLKRRRKCVVCGERHPATFEFHHRDPSTKVKAVSVLVNTGATQERIIEEIMKCDVLCANCHRKHHWNLRQEKAQ